MDRTDCEERACLSDLADGLAVLEPDDDHEGERQAESAWLRCAESAGFEEALYDSYVDSGLRLR